MERQRCRIWLECVSCAGIGIQSDGRCGPCGGKGFRLSNAFHDATSRIPRRAVLSIAEPEE